MLICRPNHTRQTLRRTQWLWVLLRMMATAPPLKAFCFIDDLLQGVVLVFRVEVAHAALRDEDLDFAVQRVGEILREIDGEAMGVFDDIGVDEDLPWLAEVEGQGVLLEELAVGFGAFAAHGWGGAS